MEDEIVDERRGHGGVNMLGLRKITPGHGHPTRFGIGLPLGKAVLEQAGRKRR